MKAKFISLRHEAGNAVSFFFDLPTSNYTWVPGQYLSLSFNENDDSHDNKHWFTIASAPESKQIQITTRDTGSAFKTRLKDLRAGTEVFISAPEGDFTWRHTDLPIVFVAGGIGITPFHSMLESRFMNNKNTNAHLVYINRDENYVLKDKLEKYKTAMPSLKIDYQTGQVDNQLITNVVPNINQSLVYLSGPEPMVESVGAELITSGLNENQLIRDWFPGYNDTNF